jgi:hypothetical protein
VLRSKIGKFIFAASYAALSASEALLRVCGPLSGCILDVRFRNLSIGIPEKRKVAHNQILRNASR